MAKYKLYTDGSYEKKLGIAGIGGHLVDENNNVIFKFSEKLTEPETFKYHESIAMLKGIRKALEYGITELECFSDEKSISDNFNSEKFNPTESNVILSHPYKRQIAALLDNFSSISFNYLPRIHNKEADKLAGNTLKNHKHETFQLQKRKAFIGQEDKLLYVPNLICEEDYHETNNVYEFAVKRKPLINHYLVAINKDKNVVGSNNLIINYYLIERNPKDHKKIVSHLLKTQEININKLFVTVTEGLTEVFNNSNLQTDIGLMFKAANFLRYPEMMLRKRATLHRTNTELINDFINSASKFPTIILHNDEKLIKTHDLLLEQNNTENLHNLNKKFP